MKWWPFRRNKKKSEPIQKKSEPIHPSGTRKERIIGRLEAELGKPGITEHRRRQLLAGIALHKGQDSMHKEG